ncbi:hypothetical protein EZ428_23825 [Pedobacter frigiditerrae]|uniref:Uncharacterized protein n=1 Tax=Pedobacter frigiditerrae TaxID=2530452 RepID=A0A4R0MIV0_9SPHI|nr:hypothetical protein [Pedobacter frigiditerrae]TCC86495.1 hypothetical protein EZ428_23825 [Pedobacter frigiditerrae]
MKKLLMLLLLVFTVTAVHAQKTVVYQQMSPRLNKKTVEGIITETYVTQRKGLTFIWFRLGNDTLVHVWKKHLDTTKMKVGAKTTFRSIKRLQGNLWRKEKSEIPLPPKAN